MIQNENSCIMNAVGKAMNLVRWLQSLREEHMQIRRDQSFLREAKAMGWAERLAEGRVTGIAIGILEGQSLGRTEGRLEGIDIGEALGDLNRSRHDILDLLEEIGQIPKEIHDRIRAEEDTETLRRWLKAAARATNFDDFREKMA